MWSLAGLVAWGGVVAAPVPAFEIPNPVRTVDGRWRLRHPAGPEAYFVLYQGTNAHDIHAPQSLSLGSTTDGWLTATGLAHAAFFRVGRVPVDTPLDLDADGIDDVFELRYPTALDPLNPADAARDTDGDGRSNLDEYRAGSDPTGGGVTWTVSVVDVPAPGSRVEFRTLVEAIDHLNSVLPADQAGRILLATETPQDVETLEIRGEIGLEVDPAYSGRALVRGPGVGPLVIRAPGGLGLTGLRVQNAGGLQVQAGRRIVVRGNHLPATAMELGSAGASRALAGVGRHDAGGMSATVADSVFSGPLHLNWFGNASAGASLGITENSAPAIQASVSGVFGGQASIRGNVSQDVAITFDALAAAQVTVADMENLDRLMFRGEASGNPTLQFNGLMAGVMSLEFAGSGSVFASLATVTSKTLTLDVGGSQTDIDAQNITADEIVMNLTSPASGPMKLRHQQRNVTASGGIRFNAWNAEHGEVDLSLALVNMSELELKTQASTTLHLQDQVHIRGLLRATVRGDVLTFDAVGAQVEAGVQIQMQGAAAGIQGFWQGGAIRGRAEIEHAYGATVGLTIDGAIFDAGGLLSIIPGGSEQLLGSGIAPGPRPRQSLATRASGEDSAIVLRNLTQAPGAVRITEVDASVTFEKCSFNSSGFLPAVVLESIQRPIRITECQFVGQGVAISEAQDEVTVSEVNIQPSDGILPSLGIHGVSALVEKLVVQGGLNGLALNLSDHATVRETRLLGTAGITLEAGRVTLEDVTIQGATTVTYGQVTARQSRFGETLSILGSGRIGFENLALGGTMILDFNPDGGLLVDPVSLGASPDEIYSAIDFDRDPQHCADYPPPQTRPDTGACVRDGVAAP